MNGIMRKYRSLFVSILSALVCLNHIPAAVLAENIDSSKPVYTVSGDEYVKELSIGADDNDDLFAEFVNNAFTGLTEAETYDIRDTASAQSKEFNGNRLIGLDKELYDCLVRIIVKVSDGTITNTEFVIDFADLNLVGPYTAADLGVDAIVVDNAISQAAMDKAVAKTSFDLAKILDALRSDCPFELFWYDKTISTTTECAYSFGASFNQQLDAYTLTMEGSITFFMPVAKEYSASDAVGTYELNNVIQTVNTAVTNARAVISDFSGSSDYEKVIGYKDRISEMVDYNHSAADESTQTPYGNPWQLIWVFDGDETTNVVCEGYAKAFKYLCDMTAFDSDAIYCYLVTGMMNSERHMWNIIRMDDSSNYLVDVTNCDDGSIGNPEYLFLKGYTSQENPYTAEDKDEDGIPYTYETAKYVYSINNTDISYYYDKGTEDLFTDDELTISADDYSESEGPGPGPGISQISLTPKEASLNIGETLQITAWAINVDDIVWTSSDSTVATVDNENSKGLVTALKAGTAVIRAASTSDPTVYDECTITVGDDSEDDWLSAFNYTVDEENATVTLNTLNTENIHKNITVHKHAVIDDRTYEVILTQWSFRAEIDPQPEDLFENTVTESIVFADQVALPESCTFMLSRYRNLKSVDLSNADMSCVSALNYFFYECTALESINLSKVDTPCLKELNYTFAYCEKLTQLDVSGLDTLNVESMFGTFQGCTSLVNLDLTGFITDNVTTMHNLFYQCESLKNLQLGEFTNKKLCSIESMFMFCSALETVDLSGFYTPAVVNASSLFCECKSLKEVDLTSFDTSNFENMQQLFYYCGDLARVNLSSFNTEKVTTMRNMFTGCNSLSTLDVSNFNTSNVDAMYGMFAECTSLEQLDLSGFDTSKVTDMGAMFADCRSLKHLDVSNFNTSNVVGEEIPGAHFAFGMGSMFFGCESLTSLDLSSFDTSNVKDMYSMFSECASLTELDLSNFNTINVESLDCMFFRCTSLKHVDISNFDTSSTENVCDMFFYCNSLESVVLGEKFVDWNSDITMPDGLWMNKDIKLALSASNLCDQYHDNAAQWSGKWEKAAGNTVVFLEPSNAAIHSGETMTLNANVFSIEENSPAVEWSSSDPSIVSVDSNGVVTGHTAGKATITASAGEFTAMAEITVANVFINSRSAALEDKIQARIYVYVPDAELETTYITTTFNGTSKTEYAKTMETAVRSGRTCRLVTVDTFAKQMRDDIVVKVHEEDGTPKYLEYEGADVTDGYVFHVEDYVKAVEEKATDEKLIDLVRKMNWYGLYAQKQFSYYPVEFEVPAVITDFNNAVLNDYAVQNTGTAEGITYTSGSLQLDADTGIKVNYTLTGTDDISKYTFTVDGTEVQPKLVSGKKYYVTFKGIPAKKLNEWHTITVTDKNGNMLTTKYCGLTYTYSVVSNTSAPDTLKDLCRSIYLYWEAADKYFNKTASN